MSTLVVRERVGNDGDAGDWVSIIDAQNWTLDQFYLEFWGADGTRCINEILAYYPFLEDWRVAEMSIEDWEELLGITKKEG